MDPPRDRLRVRAARPSRVDHDCRSSLALVAVQERLRERAHHDRQVGVVGPVPVVPPGDIARPEPVLGGAAVSGQTVDEPEPVVPLPDIALDAVDGLDEAAAVARLQLRLRAERAQQRFAGRYLRLEHHHCPSVAGDPERRRAGAALRAAATRECEGDEDERNGGTARAAHLLRIT